MDYILLINGIYGGCNPFRPFTNFLGHPSVFFCGCYVWKQPVYEYKSAFFFRGEITKHCEAIYTNRFRAHLVEFVHARHSIYGSFFKVTFWFPKWRSPPSEKVTGHVCFFGGFIHARRCRISEPSAVGIVVCPIFNRALSISISIYIYLYTYIYIQGGT